MLYFIQDSGNLSIKLGYTGKDDAMERLAVLQTGNSSLLVLLGTCPGEREDEIALQRQFSSAHVGGEWFRPVPGLLRFIISRAGLAFLSRAYSQVADRLLAEESTDAGPAAEEAHDPLQSGFVPLPCDLEDDLPILNLPPSLPARVMGVFTEKADQPLNVTTIADALKLPRDKMSHLRTALCRLTADGLIRRLAPGWYFWSTPQTDLEADAS